MSYLPSAKSRASWILRRNKVARYNFFVFSNCTDPSREEEFNRWYTHIHLPDLSHAKGLVSTKRYVDPEPNSKAKYLAVYEFETEDIDESIQSH